MGAERGHKKQYSYSILTALHANVIGAQAIEKGIFDAFLKCFVSYSIAIPDEDGDTQEMDHHWCVLGLAVSFM